MFVILLCNTIDEFHVFAKILIYDMFIIKVHNIYLKSCECFDTMIQNTKERKNVDSSFSRVKKYIVNISERNLKKVLMVGNMLFHFMYLATIGHLNPRY